MVKKMVSKEIKKEVNDLTNEIGDVIANKDIAIIVTALSIKLVDVFKQTIINDGQTKEEVIDATFEMIKKEVLNNG